MGGVGTPSEDCYLLRSNLNDTDAKTLWKHYIQLTEAEWAFRITKDEIEGLEVVVTSRASYAAIKEPKVALDATLRNHCKIILGFVAGNGAQAIAKLGLGSSSQVYRVAERFVEEGPAGLVDRREDNGETKADEYYRSVLMESVGTSLLLLGDAAYPLKKGDVITRIEDYGIDNYGLVQADENLPLLFPHLAPKLARTNSVTVGLIRGAKPIEVELPVSRERDFRDPIPQRHLSCLFRVWSTCLFRCNRGTRSKRRPLSHSIWHHEPAGQPTKRSRRI